MNRLVVCEFCGDIHLVPWEQTSFACASLGRVELKPEQMKAMIVHIHKHGPGDPDPKPFEWNPEVRKGREERGHIQSKTEGE